MGDESGFLCQGYPVILYTLQVRVIITIITLFIWCSFAILQGATILSLTCVTLNQATLLFCENKIEKITQKRVSLFFSKPHKSQWSPCAIAYWEDKDVSLGKVAFIKNKVTFILIACCWILPLVALLPSLSETYGRSTL